MRGDLSGCGVGTAVDGVTGDPVGCGAGGGGSM